MQKSASLPSSRTRLESKLSEPGGGLPKTPGGKFIFVEEDDRDSKTDHALALKPTISQGVVKKFARNLNRGRKRGKSKVSKVPPLPPNLNVGGRQILSTRLRFDVTATVSSVQIADYMLLAAVGVIATTTTTVATIASAVRLKRITIWPSAGGEATVYWAPAPAAAPGMPDVGNDESIPTGVTMDHPVTTVPPKESLAYFWHNPLSSTPVTLFKISATIGSIIDVEVDFTLCRAIIPDVLSVTAASVNSFYGFYLDGTSSHKIQPLAVPSI